MLRTTLLLGLATLLLAGCRSGDAPASSPTPSTPDLSLPATFAGTTPCAECAGIDMTLHLRSDSTFTFRRIYRGVPDDRDSVFTDAGDWAWEDSTLLLFDETGGSFFVRAVGDSALRVLDHDRQEITSPLPYTLTRTSTQDAAETTPSR